MTASAGRSASSVVRMSRRLVSAASRSGASARPRRCGAQADLGGRLLAGDVDGGGAAAGEGGGGLQQQRRLADAGVAADEDGGGRDEAAAEHAVELGDAGEGARQRRLGRGEVAERDAAAARRPEGAAGRAVGEAGLLGDRVPGAAGVAAAGPFRVGGAAGGADEAGACGAWSCPRSQLREVRAGARIVRCSAVAGTAASGSRPYEPVVMRAAWAA